MRPFLSDVSFTAVSHALAAAAALALQVLLARSLPTQVFGAFLIMQAMIALVETIFVSRSGEVALYWLGRTWSTDIVLARSYGAFLARREVLWNTSIYLLLVIAAWPLALIMQIDPVLLLLLGLSIPLHSGYGVTKSVFIAAGQIRAQSLFEIAYTLASVLTAVALTLAFGLPGFVCATVASTAAKTFAGRRVVERFWPIGTRNPKPVSPPSSTLSVHSILRNLCSSIAGQADVLMLGAAAPKETVAIYKVAKTLAGVPARIAAPVWMVLRPQLLVRLRDGDDVGLRRLLTMPAFAFAAVGVLAAPLLWLSAANILAALYGETYRSSATPFLVLFAGIWWFSAVTGWLGFIAMITARKAVTSLLFVLYVALTVGGTLAAGSSAIQMAVAVAGAMGVVGLIAWAMLYRQRLLVKA